MTRDEIIRMAREAGATTGVKDHLNCDGDSVVFVPDELERFAALVAAAEREECAKVCEEWENVVDSHKWPSPHTLAQEIRARESQ